MYAQKQETQCFGLEFPMISGRLWRNVAFVRPAPKSSKPIGNVSDVPPHAWHTLGTDLFYWNKIDLPGDRRLLLQVPDR